MFRRLKCGGWPYSQPPNVDFEVNFDSEQSDGLALWMPWGGGTPGARRHVDRIKGLAFAEAGTPVWVSDGERGHSMLFDDGANEFLEASIAVRPVTPLTLAARFNSDDGGAQQDILTMNMGGWNNVHLRLFVAGDAVGNPVRSGCNDAVTSTTTGYSVNTWHHACAPFYDDTNRAIFIDGGSKGTTNLLRTPANLINTIIGKRSFLGSPYYFSGRIADVRIYNRALTDAQVYQMYANPWELWRPRLRRAWVLAPAVANVKQIATIDWANVKALGTVAEASVKKAATISAN